MHSTLFFGSMILYFSGNVGNVDVYLLFETMTLTFRPNDLDFCKYPPVYLIMIIGTHKKIQYPSEFQKTKCHEIHQESIFHARYVGSPLTIYVEWIIIVLECDVAVFCISEHTQDE